MDNIKTFSRDQYKQQRDNFKSEKYDKYESVYFLPPLLILNFF